ncbi:uncharacterized protein [Anabrus simplex]|uniref:uncharacterized protein n=1 Tax=Anabrus simplex TaxID=316456 RepID=UPI0035A2F341
MAQMEVGSSETNSRLMYTSEHIKNMFLNIGRRFLFVEMNNTNSVERFDATVRTEFPPNNKGYVAQCTEWVEVFSTLTRSTWIIEKESHSEVVYKCTQQPCNAIISFKKYFTEDRNFNDGLDIEVTVHFRHTHQTFVASTCCALNMSNVTKMKFINYFKEGMNPLAAKQYHERLVVENGCEDMLTNELYNPPSCQVYYLFHHWRAHNGILEAVKCVMKEESSSGDCQISEAENFASDEDSPEK